MGNSSGTKFSRCNPESAFKGFQKIFVFAETRHFGNFACAVTRLFQQLGGMAQTQFYNVGNYGYAFVLFEDFAKVDQMPVLEGKRMTIQLSPKKKEMPKKPAASKPVTQGQKAEKPEAGEEE